LIELHHRGGRGLPDALKLCAAAVEIGDEPPPRHDHVLDHIT